MTDIDLLILGCGVSFIAVAGFYVYIRERLTADEKRARTAPVPVRSTEGRPRPAG